MNQNLDQSTLARMTVDIVAAYTAHNTVKLTELPDIIRTVANRLLAIGEEPAPEPAAKPEPAVPVRRSVQPDHLICLLCGKKQKLLKRHLAVEHQLAPASYRQWFDLGSDYPMAAPHYSAARSELAHKIGLGHRPARGPTPRA